MKMATFKSSNKSVYFENGTTSHLSFSSCKQQNGSIATRFVFGTSFLLCLALNHAYAHKTTGVAIKHVFI